MQMMLRIYAVENGENVVRLGGRWAHLGRHCLVPRRGFVCYWCDDCDDDGGLATVGDGGEHRGRDGGRDIH